MLIGYFQNYYNFIWLILAKNRHHYFLKNKLLTFVKPGRQRLERLKMPERPPLAFIVFRIGKIPLDLFG